MEEINIMFQGRIELSSVRSRVSDYLHKHASTSHVLLKLLVIEALNNAVQHGNKNEPNGLVTLKMRITAKRTLFIRIKDTGSGFPGNERLLALRQSIDNPFDQLIVTESGRGMLIMDAVADFVRYNRVGNEILLVKKISVSP